MGEGKKKIVMIVVIVVCLAVAAGMTLSMRGGGSNGLEGIPDSDKVWVKCANEQCAAHYEIGKRQYYQFIRENTDPVAMSVAPMTCGECGKQSVFGAEKCPRCSTVFFRDAAKPGDFSDRCPECGYSKQEDEREKRAAGARQ